MRDDARATVKTFWALEYINGQQFIGRFNQHWTRGSSLAGAALFETKDEAEQALQALRQEAEDRINRQPHAAQMWWDIHGGLTVVREVEQALRVLEPEAGRRLDGLGR